MSDRSVDFTLRDQQQEMNQDQKEFLKTHFSLTGESRDQTFDVSNVFNIRQVHGKKVVLANHQNDNTAPSIQEADGLLTNELNLPIVVRTADCLPIYLYDPKKHCIGILHAGWRSSQANIVETALELMKQCWQSDSEDIKVAFGPSIRSCCYEVGSEFGQYFPLEIVQRGKQDYLDLPKVNQRHLLKKGVSQENIFDCNICTCCDHKYFSYRREGADVGKMLSMIMLKSHQE
jgi:polyphenol oxidase